MEQHLLQTELLMCKWTLCHVSIWTVLYILANDCVLLTFGTLQVLFLTQPLYAVLSEAMVTMHEMFNVFENTAFLFLGSTQFTWVIFQYFTWFRKYGCLCKYTKSNLCISNVNLLSLCIPGPIWCCWLLSLGLGCCDGSGQQEISARAVHSIGHHLPQLSHGPWTLAVLLPASASFC